MITPEKISNYFEWPFMQLMVLKFDKAIKTAHGVHASSINMKNPLIMRSEHFLVK